MNKLITIVIPVFRNAGSLENTHKQLAEIFPMHNGECNTEIIFVDDGSDDASYTKIKEICEKDRRVQGIRFTRNFGQMAAVIAGMRRARGDAVVMMSADLQDPPKLIRDMVEAWINGAKVVVAYRTNRHDSLAEKLTSKLAYGFLRKVNPLIPNGGFDFVLMDRETVWMFTEVDIRHRFLQGDVLWAGYQTVFLPYERQRREAGVSQYNFRKRLKLFIDAVLDSTYIPIRAMTLIGFLFAILGFLYGLSVVVGWAFKLTPFPGWAPIMVSIWLTSGVIILMLGVIGEYIWRIYDEIRKKPFYVVESEHGASTKERPDT